MTRETSRCMANWRGITKCVQHSDFKGSRLCQLRTDAGYKTAVSFAIACGIGISTYNCLETGDRLPNYKQKEAIAKTLDMTIEEVFPEKKPKINITVIYESPDDIEASLIAKYGSKLMPRKEVTQ